MGFMLCKVRILFINTVLICEDNEYILIPQFKILYVCKFQSKSPNFVNCINFVKNNRDTEYHIAKRNGKLSIHYKKNGDLTFNWPVFDVYNVGEVGATAKIFLSTANVL